MKQECTVVLIAKGQENFGLGEASNLVQGLREKKITEIIPLPGKPVGCHIEDLDGKNIGLSGLNPPMPAGHAFHVEELLGLRGFIRLGPDIPGTSWAAVVEVKGWYEYD